MSTKKLYQQSADFLNHLDDWMIQLPTISLTDAVNNPKNCAIFSVDVVNGFCKEGALSSRRIARIIKPVVELFNLAWSYGIRDILLINDSHEPDAVEFSAFPPHCIRGTKESEPVDEIKELSFFNEMRVFSKNSVAPGCNSGLEEWMADHSRIDTCVVVGDCTDICTYQLALLLLTNANSVQIKRRIIVPVDCVDTYDRSLETALAEGGMAHPGDLFHAIFLYHMALNGIEIVKHIEK